MTKPTAHLNGTGARDLYVQYHEAYMAVGRAIETVIYASPHGRDYYVQGDTALSEALKEHESRLERLRSVRSELEDIALHCYDAHMAREARRRA